MAGQAIDLSAGFVPKNPVAPPPDNIDLSAGFVPKVAPATAKPDYLSKTEDFINDAGNGIWKSAGRLPLLLSRGLNKIPYVGETLAPSAGVKAFDAATTPQNTGEKVGGAIEQAGEMALTGGPLKNLATGAAARLPAFLRFAAPVAAPALRIGAEALNTGANAAAHDQAVGTAAAMGGAGAAAGEVAPYVAPFLKKAAIAQYEKALAPTTKINKSIAKDIVPSLIDRKEFGSMEGLENKATQNIKQLQPELNQEYQSLEQASPKPVGGTQGQLPGAGKQVIADLESAKNDFMAGGKIADPAGIDAINGVQGIVKQYGSDVSPTTLRELRQVFENPVAQAGGYAGTDLTTHYALNAKQAAADSIRRILNSSPSDIGALNKEISFWLDVQRVTRASALRTTGQQGGLLKTLSPLVTGAVASSTGLQMGAERGIEAGVTAALSTAAYQATRSPLWRTASSVFKGRFADALSRGSVGEVTTLLGRLGVAAQGAMRTQPQSGPQTSPAPAQQ